MLRNRRTALAALTAILLLGLVPALAPRVSAALPVELDPVLVERLAATSPTDELIVFVHADRITTSREAALDAGLGIIETWDRIGVTVAAGTPSEITSLRDVTGLTYLEADRPITFFQDTSQTATRADLVHPEAAGGTGIDGTGTSIAIVDSGIRGAHPAFGDRVPVNLKNVCPFLCEGLTGSQGDTNDDVWVPEPVTNDTDTFSNGGHGTHVAGIAAAGFDNVTASSGTFTGSAPGATLIGLSVGQLISVYGGNSGLNWVLEHHENPCEVNGEGEVCAPIVAVNNSYGPVGGGPYDEKSATAKLQHELVLEGVTVVWAAGNDGGDGSTDNTNPPGKSPVPGVISVASYDDADSGTQNGTLSDFSSRGKAGDTSTYPDLSAPGDGILSTCGPALPICKGGDILDPDYGVISGTSMAAPHIAGYVALLKEANPALTPGEIEFILEETAHQFSFGGAYEPDPRNEGDETSFDKGHGLVDVAAAVAVARGETAPEPVPPTPCPVGSTQLEDAEGDASLAGQGLRPEPNVDIVGVTYDYLPANGVTPATIAVMTSVADLRGDTEPPTLVSDGEVFDLGFSVGGTGYYLRASRSIRSESFVLRKTGDGDAGTADVTIAGAGVTGDFDGDADVVTLRLPLTAVEPGLVDGAELSSLTATAWTSEGVVLLRADDAAGPCPFTAAPAPASDPDDEDPPVEEPDGKGRDKACKEPTGKSGEQRKDGGRGCTEPDDTTSASTWSPTTTSTTSSSTELLLDTSGEVPEDSLMRTCGIDPITQAETGPPEEDDACIAFEVAAPFTEDFFGFVIADLFPTSADGGDVLRDYDVYVYDEAGNEVGSAADVGGREHAFVQVPGGAPADYTVLVQPYTALAGDTFDISVRFGSLDDQPR